MEIFISHSWKNKTCADKLARDLAGTATIWIDHQQTKPGEDIGDDIREGLDRADVVVLLWSHHAAESDWVRQEIDHVLRTNRATLIPCLLDDTPLPARIEHTAAIPFTEYSHGFGRLNLALVRKHAADLGLDLGDVQDKLNDWEGVADFVNNHRQKGQLSEDDAYWIERVLQSTNEAYASGSARLKQYGEGVELLQSVMDRLEGVKHDREGLQQLLYEVIRKEHLAPPIMQQVRVTIEQMIESLPSRAVGSAPGAPTSGDTGAIRAARVSEPSAAGDPAAQLRRHLQGRVPPAEAQAVAESLLYYTQAAAPALQALGAIAGATASPAGATVVQHLYQYIQSPDDLLPESHYGAFGYIDDAWLVHNTVWRLIEAGVVPAQSFAVDWVRIQAGDALVRQLLPPVALGQLENLLMQFLAIIASEVRGYQPGFSAGGGGYHPYMSRDDVAMESLRLAVDAATW